MIDLLPAVLVFLTAYLIGGIPFGYLVARWKGVDIFQQGSGNIGATNVGRVLGRKFGLFVFALDFTKGALPVLAAHLLAEHLAGGWSAAELGVLAGLGTVLGHLFSIYLRLRGGKGVATGAGVVFVLVPVAAMFGLLTWVAVVSASRYVSLASLAAAVVLCLVRCVQTWPTPLAPGERVVTVFCIIVAALVFVRHRPNIVRLLQGKESRLKDSATMQHIARIVHVVSLGLWFGTTIFFLIAALCLFDSFETLGQNPQRPAWFPLSDTFSKATEAVHGPREQGSRAAGFAISPLFDRYFLVQGVCGFLAVATAWSWQYRFPRQRIHSWRVTVLLLGLAAVVAGWPLEWEVSRLRAPRNEQIERYLTASTADAEEARDSALQARRTFGLWHMVSLLLNFITILLVTVGMALAAYLPPVRPETVSAEENKGIPAPDGG